MPRRHLSGRARNDQLAEYRSYRGGTTTLVLFVIESLRIITPNDDFLVLVSASWILRSIMFVCLFVFLFVFLWVRILCFKLYCLYCAISSASSCLVSPSSSSSSLWNFNKERHQLHSHPRGAPARRQQLNQSYTPHLSAAHMYPCSRRSS